MRHYIDEDQKMRLEYRDRDRERQMAEDHRIAEFAREQAQREDERRAVKSAQNEYRERLQQEVTVYQSINHLFAHNTSSNEAVSV